MSSRTTAGREPLLCTRALFFLAIIYIYVPGNLCRCTGYRPILEGLMPLTVSRENSAAAGCPKGNECCTLAKSMGNNAGEKVSKSWDFSPYDPSQEPIFPPELMVRNK